MNELKQQWQALRAAQPSLRIRDAASRLGVSEAALLETRANEGVTRLSPRIDTIASALPRLGTVMSLIRNEAAVHEKDIAFPSPRNLDRTVVFDGADFSVCLEPALFAHAFYVEDANPKGALRSIQLFDATGGALWKIYARDKANHSAFDDLLADLVWPQGVVPLSFTKTATPPPPASGTPFPLQAAFESVAAQGLPVVLEVENRAVRQSHRGALVRIVRMGSWLNVLDPGFDWHLNEAALSGTGVSGEDLILRLPDHTPAARLSLAPDATAHQRKLWQGLLEEAPA